MDAGDRLWKAITNIRHESTLDEIMRLTDEILALPVPWTTRLGGLGSILFEVVGDQSGVSVYTVARPGQDLVALASAGRPGPLTVTWGAPVSGLAIQEGATQFVGSARALSTYFGGWLNVAECIAVPLIRERRGYGVLEARSATPGHIDLFTAEVVNQVAARIAKSWPAPGDRDDPLSVNDMR